MEQNTTVVCRIEAISHMQLTIWQTDLRYVDLKNACKLGLFLKHTHVQTNNHFLKVIIELMVTTCWLLQAAAAAFIIKTIAAKAGNLNMMFTEINRCRSTNGNW